MRVGARYRLALRARSLRGCRLATACARQTIPRAFKESIKRDCKGRY